MIDMNDPESLAKAVSRAVEDSQKEFIKAFSMTLRIAAREIDCDRHDRIEEAVSRGQREILDKIADHLENQVPREMNAFFIFDKDSRKIRVLPSPEFDSFQLFINDSLCANYNAGSRMPYYAWGAVVKIDLESAKNRIDDVIEARKEEP